MSAAATRKKKPIVTCNDTEALRYAGGLGHPYAVTCDLDDTGNRRILGECNDEATALKWADGANRGGVNANGRAWRRIKGGYAAVRRSS